MSITIAVAHHAGGVGKTTTTLNLGYSLAALGYPVCLMDLDPQGDLTERLGLEQPSNLARVLTDSQGVLNPVTVRWGVPNISLDIVTSDLDTMANVEMALTAVTSGRDLRVKRALAHLRDRYAYILIDCPPAISLLTTNALNAADQLLIPVQAQPKAYRQIPNLLGTVAAINDYRDVPLRIIRYLVCMLDTTTMAQSVLATMREEYGAAVFTTVIPRRVKAQEDSLWRAPIAVQDPRNGSATAYAALAEEVLARDQAQI